MADTPEVALRKAVYTAIAAAQVAESLSIFDFTLEQTHYPHADLKALPDAGIVTVICLAIDEDKITRGNAYQAEVPVQVAVQKKVDPTDTAGIDEYLGLVGELRDVARTLDHDTFAWQRTDALKDQNGTPFHFVGLREASTLEAFFTAYYMATGS